MTVDRSSQQVIRRNEKSFDIATAMLKATATKGKNHTLRKDICKCLISGICANKMSMKATGLDQNHRNNNQIFAPFPIG